LHRPIPHSSDHVLYLLRFGYLVHRVDNISVCPILLTNSPTLCSKTILSSSGLIDLASASHRSRSSRTVPLPFRQLVRQAFRGRIDQFTPPNHLSSPQPPSLLPYISLSLALFQPTLITRLDRNPPHLTTLPPTLPHSLTHPATVTPPHLVSHIPRPSPIPSSNRQHNTRSRIGTSARNATAPHRTAPHRAG